MQINQRAKDFLLGLLGIGLFISFLIFVIAYIFVYSYEAITETYLAISTFREISVV